MVHGTVLMAVGIGMDGVLRREVIVLNDLKRGGYQEGPFAEWNGNCFHNQAPVLQI
jgi:hypothetical protein